MKTSEPRTPQHEYVIHVHVSATGTETSRYTYCECLCMGKACLCPNAESAGTGSTCKFYRYGSRDLGENGQEECHNRALLEVPTPTVIGEKGE
jgi:hypothetical protein